MSSLRGGCMVEQQVPGPPGSPQNPMTYEEVIEKFHLLVEPVLGRSQAERLATLVATVEKLDTVQAMTELLYYSQCPGVG